MKSNVTQHFRKEEVQFVDMCTDWVGNVENQYTPYVTYFLNPREQFILETVAKRSDECQISYFGGYKDSERKRALLYPQYWEPEEKDFEVLLCQIDYASKFNTLTHSQILGTLMGNGLIRNVIGDIITDGLTWQFYTEKQIATYLPTQIEKIGKVSVALKEVPLSEGVEPINEWKEHEVLASSLRLDSVMSSLYNMSRQKTKEVIEAGQVKVNWLVITRPAFELDVKDIVSVRKYGRFQYISNQGLTKKSKEKLSIRAIQDKT